MTDYRDVPLWEMAALPLAELERSLSRVLPESAAVPVAAFQSSL